MAPSQSHVVTLAAGSALLIGVLYTLYLLKKRNKNNDDSARKSSKKAPKPKEQTFSDVLPQSDALVGSPPSLERSESLMVPEDDIIGSPLADREGMTVSASWAILNTSNQSSPHLSPVSSQTSLVEGTESESISMINGFDDDSLLAGGDSTQSTTVLEAGDSTILQEKLRTSARLSSTEREVVTVQEITMEYEDLLRDHTQTDGQTFSSAEITEALMASQNPSQGLTDRQAEVLAGLLTYEDLHLRHAAVQGIGSCATFTNNQNLLREKEALPRLAKLLELQRMAMWMRHDHVSAHIPVTINAITNMAINQDNTGLMEACVPTLVDISLDKETGESVCLAALQALTNLSYEPQHHGHYTRLVQTLYEFLPLSSDGGAAQQQALKVLINLSTNPDMVPHLLAAKAPAGLLTLLQPTATDANIILRFTTFLANVLHVVKDRNITSSSLPSVDKAPSPETMYTALMGLGNAANLKNKVFLLCKHSDEGVRAQAAKVYHHLK